jgi:rare lipoprotein A
VLKSILLSASIALSALAPIAVEAKSSCGYASHYGYGDGFAWRTMANGRPMNPDAMTTAHPSLPMGTKIRVVNPANGKSVNLVISDRGPYHGGRILDLSSGAFSRIASLGQGIARVCFSRV